MKVAAMVVGLALLAGCAGQGASSGLRTVLGPGEVIMVEAAGRSPRVSVDNRGPGSVIIAGGAMSQAVTVAGQETTEIPIAGTLLVTNTSDTRVEVSVQVSGADKIDIRGPVVKGK